MGSEGRIGTILVIAAIFVVLFLGLCWWGYATDDSFINYRYAENIVTGYGAVFNIGERVEGYSSPLWVFLLALPTLLGASPIWVSKSLGLGCAGVLILLLFFSLRKSSCNPLIAGIGCLWLAAVPYAHIYTCSGMETIPYMLAVSFAVFLPLLLRTRRATVWLFPVSMITVATLRPEGILVALSMTIWWLIWRRGRFEWAGAIITWVSIAILYALRVWYYGELVPNTYVAKPSPVLAANSDGFVSMVQCVGAKIVGDLDPFVASLGGFVLLGLGIFAILDKNRRFVSGGALLVFVVGAVFVVYAPHDWMPGHRFGLPYSAAFIFAGALGLDLLRERLSTSGQKLLTIALVIGVCGWMMLCATKVAKFWTLYQWEHVNPGMNGGLYADIGRWLADNSSPEDRILAYEIGAVGYYSRRYIIDHEGLINRSIGGIIQRAGGYEEIRYGNDTYNMERVADICVDYEPDWFLVRSSRAGPFEIGKPVDPEVAQETVQGMVIAKEGDAMVLARVFSLHKTNNELIDNYLLLQRRSAGDTLDASP